RTQGRDQGHFHRGLREGAVRGADAAQKLSTEQDVIERQTKYRAAIQDARRVSVLARQVQGDARLRRQAGPELYSLPSSGRSGTEFFPRRPETNSRRSPLSLAHAQRDWAVA